MSIFRMSIEVDCTVYIAKEIHKKNNKMLIICYDFIVLKACEYDI